jgi:hypothetical protein
MTSTTVLQIVLWTNLAWILVTGTIVRFLRVKGGKAIWYAWNDGINSANHPAKKLRDLARWQYQVKGIWPYREAKLEDLRW